jgi:hypothetical protein
LRLIDNGDSFTVWLSANETYQWARRPGEAWPCSQLAGHRVRASFDTNGLYDYAVDGRYHDDLDCNEFNALIADHVGGRLHPNHPCYFVAVGQFDG